MADVNTVVIVSDRESLIKQVSQKLVLLRNIDKIKSCSIDEAQNMLEGYSPNVLILHCERNNLSVISLIKKLKQDDIYKNIPILLINDNCSRETIIEAFDNGISDALFMPIIDYELLIRTIWCLKKNELEIAKETREEFLTSLGILQKDTGVCSEKYCDEFLKNEIAQTKKYAQKACLLFIEPDEKYPERKSNKEFIGVIRKSIRLNDTIAMKGKNRFYVYLQKTKLNGAYSVFERINTNLGIESGANAGVVEIQDQEFEDILDALDAALDKASENTNSLIVASDFYTEKTKPLIDFEAHRNQMSAKGILENEQRQQEEPRRAFDKTSIKLFNQAYDRKLRVVIEPVFKKYEYMLKSQSLDFAVNSYTGTKSMFSVSSGEVSAAISIEYNGIEQAVVRLTIVDNDRKKLFETDTVDFTILNYKKVSMMVSELIDKFMIILKKRSKDS